MTLRIPKKGTGSAWSKRYWTPVDHPTVTALLDLKPATRKWLWTAPGPGIGWYWTLTDFPQRDIDAVWQSDGHSTYPEGSTALFSACGAKVYGKVEEVVDTDRALWMPTNPWGILEALHAPHPSLLAQTPDEIAAGPFLHKYGYSEVSLTKLATFNDAGEHRGFRYEAKVRQTFGDGAHPLEAVLNLADKIKG